MHALRDAMTLSSRRQDPMKLKMLLLLAASALSVIVLACSEVVFPTPLPTATPAPTATPIVFPTPLPTATPFSIPSPLPTATPSAIIFPTPLPTGTPAPTATPVSIPSPLPTATPSALVFPTPLPTATPAPTATPMALPPPVAFPTPLPTATPAPTATPISLTTRYTPNSVPFATIDIAKVQPLLAANTDYGTGFAFRTGSDQCESTVCLLTTWHLVGSPRLIGGYIHDGSEKYAHNTERLTNGPAEADENLDIAVVRTIKGRAKGLTPFDFAPPGTPVRVGDPVRVIAIDFYGDSYGHHHADQMVLSGVVSRIVDEDVRFMIDAPLIQGNSGGVVLNARMQVIGMYVSQLKYGLGRLPDGSSRELLRSRNMAVHVEAIRGKLCEWGYLVGSDCR